MGFWDAIGQAAAAARRQPVPEGLTFRGYGYNQESEEPVPVGQTPDGSWFWEDFWGAWHALEFAPIHVVGAERLTHCVLHRWHRIVPADCLTKGYAGKFTVAEISFDKLGEVRAEVYRLATLRLWQLAEGEENAAHLLKGGILVYDEPELRKLAPFHTRWLPKTLLDSLFAAARAGDVSQVQTHLRELQALVKGDGIPAGRYAGTWRSNGGAGDQLYVIGYCPECGRNSVGVTISDTGWFVTGRPAEHRWQPSGVPELAAERRKWEQWLPQNPVPVCQFCALER